MSPVPGEQFAVFSLTIAWYFLHLSGYAARVSLNVSQFSLNTNPQLLEEC
jgi:hypothetical protein